MLERFDRREDLDVLADERAIAILEALAPDHRKKLARRLARELGDRFDEEKLAELLRREAAFIELEARTLEQLGSRTGHADADLAQPLAALVGRGLVVRGSAVRCPQCRMRQFIALREQDELISCRACRIEFTLPVLAEDGVRERPVAYRLDGLVARSMDQDVLAPLLALRWTLRRVANPPEGAFWPGLELVRGDQAVAEIDVDASDRGQVLLVEAKRSAATFEMRQLARLHELPGDVGGTAVCAALDGEFSKRLVVYAEKHGVELLDRSALLQPYAS